MVEFKASERGDLQATITLKSWGRARDASGPYASPRDQESNGQVNVVLLRTDGERNETPSQRELESVHYLINNDEAISDALLTAIWDEYPSIRDWLSTCMTNEEVEEIAPPATRLEDIRLLVGLGTVFVLPSRAGELPYLGFELGCSWDVEHGLGAVMRGPEPVEIGDASVSFNEYTPDSDRILRHLMSLLSELGPTSSRYRLSRRQALWKHAPWVSEAQPDLGVYDEGGALVLAIDVTDFHWEGPSRWWIHFVKYRDEPETVVRMTISSSRPEIFCWKRTSRTMKEWSPIREAKGINATCWADEIGVALPLASIYSVVDILRE